MKKEILIGVGVLVAAYELSSFSFTRETKAAIRRNFNNTCAVCGLEHPKNGQCHHDVPQCRGGSDRVENGVFVCGEHDPNDCHEILDRQSLKQGICFDGLPISRQPPEKFRNRKWFQRWHRN